MPSGSPSTLLARWPSANPASAIPVLGRALTSSRPGISTGRRAVQIRPFRLPASEANGREGRNMFVVREMDGATEKVDVFVEDPTAPTAGDRDRKGKGKAAAQEDDGDEVMVAEVEASANTAGSVTHSRWTHCSVGLPPSASSAGASGAGVGALFDTFIQRALFAPPGPGGQPAQRDTPAWQPRAQAVSLEGYTFVVGAASPGAGGGDWEVKVSSVGLKGGTASGTTRGCIIEVAYLPVPYLPADSTFVKDFLLSLFPPAAVKNGEIEVVDIKEDAFIDAGLLDPPADASEEGEWEWRAKHTSFAYVHQFKKEGLL
ncbi:hypothetical protein DMC30DRAFT_414412 [Rhodotorula diobovata]|uniref:Uncharacterized protein n=1 Tax=Rhodotorula diobovata TaxID=5288 RepID=A0A5C5G432_9BASI|nr:hypothetical protein DMC30DRAFT_414412 [Rhodotorula diobovata]